MVKVTMFNPQTGEYEDVNKAVHLQVRVAELEAQLTHSQGRIAELMEDRRQLWRQIDFLTAPLFCGHPSSCLTSTDKEGYCGWCADRGK